MEKENFQLIQISTGSGEVGMLKIEDSRYPPEDWHCRYLTSDCPACQFFISPDQLGVIIPILKNTKRMRIKIPKNSQGICAVGKTERLNGAIKRVVHKFLLINQYHPIQGCKNPSNQIRLARAEERRSEGKIFL